MITLIRHPDDPKADEIEQRFKDLILSYKVETTKGSEQPGPRIKDSDTTISGDKAIEKWLRELEKEIRWQRSLTGDGCYIDPDSGTTC